MTTQRKLGHRQRQVLEVLADGRTYTMTALAAAIDASSGSAYHTVRALAGRHMVSTWTMGSGPGCTRYVAREGTEPPPEAVLDVRPKAVHAVDLSDATHVDDAPNRARLISFGQAIARAGADNHAMTSAIAAGHLRVYRGPAGPRAKRDTAWLDPDDVDRWAALRQAVATRDVWRAVPVQHNGRRHHCDVLIPVWPLGLGNGDMVEYRLEGDEIRIRRSTAPRSSLRRAAVVSDAVRREAVRRAVEGDETLSAIARDIGVSHRSISNWIRDQYGKSYRELMLERSTPEPPTHR